ncbi:MAG: hypothetical protein ABSB69_04630 [Solirubrobacteraceae bacterium]
MTASSLLRFLRGVLPLAALVAMLLAPGPARAESSFGIVPESFTAGMFQSDGVTPDTQAGDHPYAATTSFKLNTTTASGRVLSAGGQTKDLVVQLPPGFVGDPNATPQCPRADLDNTVEQVPTAENNHNVGHPPPGACAWDTQVGVAKVALLDPSTGSSDETWSVPVYNVVPSRGEVALFAFRIGPDDIDVFIHVRVRTSGDYGLTAGVSEVSEQGVPLESTVTLWGVPADPSHDAQRGQVCQAINFSGGSCGGGDNPSDATPRPFLTNPTACSGQPLTSTLSVDSWQSPGQVTASGEPVLSDPNWLTATAQSPPLTECEKLVFDPSLTVTPETTAVDTPTGLNVDLHVPQNEDPYGLATPELKDATVTLPAGVAISPSAANGLAGCTPEEIGLHTENPVSCPNASKLGTVQVTSPDLPENADGSEGVLEGFLYLGEPASGSITAPPYTIYLLAEGYGLSVRLEGKVAPDPATGQLTTTFTENPPLPFDDLKLHFFGGPRAALTTPPACGTYTTTSQLVPYSSSLAASPSSSFQTSFDGNGAPCPSPSLFAPSFTAGTTGTTAGAFSSFVMNIARPDGQQALSEISLSTPPGLLGMLSSVPLCSEPQAAQGTCPAASQIGTATAAAGAGSEPFTISGPVYLTGPYKGAPFGLSIAIPAVAGPFNFGTVIVRSAIYVDPHTAALTVISDPLPQMVDTSQGDSGVPVALQGVSVNIDRPGFILNPTSCDPMSVGGTLGSNQGASVAVSSPFQVGGCAGLAFKPSFTVSTQARTSKVYGASLDVKVTSGLGQANIHRVDVQLPIKLPTRLTTLQKACTEAQFAANPAGCPEGSFVGYATAHTPILDVPLAGPAILVSHGGAAFPDLVLVLQGQGVTIELTGNTDIKNGITYSKFETVPDAPISTFELQLPEGPHSILGAYLPAKANGSMCGQALTMPTTITGQNGAVVKQTTKISVTGCPATKATVRVTKTEAKGNGLLVTVNTTAKGTVMLSGNGLKTTTKMNANAGSHKIDVPFTTAGESLREHHEKLELRARLMVGKQAVARTTSVKL